MLSPILRCSYLLKSEFQSDFPKSSDSFTLPAGVVVVLSFGWWVFAAVSGLLAGF